MRRFLVAATAWLVLGCGSALPPPEHFAESPAGSGTWSAVPAAPAWVAAPPAVEGRLRFVAEGRSNLRAIATHRGGPSAAKEAAAAVERALAAVAGAEDSAKAGAAAAAGLRLLERACREELLTRKMVPGNTLCTAWALWEVEVETVLAVLPEGKRAAAKGALDALR